MAIDLLTTSGIESLVNSYKSSETQKQITPLNTKKSGQQNLSSAYGVVSSKLDALKSAVEELKSTSTSNVFNMKVVASSNSGIITATATSTAANSSYFVRVNRLAKSDSLVSTSKNSSDRVTTLSQYKIHVKVGTVDKDITIATDGDETYQELMQKIRDAVNSDSEVNDVLSASVFNPTSGKSKLTFTSKTSGSDNKIILSDVEGDILSQIGISGDVVNNRTIMAGNNAGYINSEANLDAELTLNGITVTRGSNTVSDLVDGVTLKLNNVMAATDTDVNLSVASDTNSIKTKVENFVNAFNGIYSYLKSNSGSNKSSRGILVGDSSSLTLLSSLSKTVYTQVSGITGGDLTLLSQIGISFNSTTGLKLDTSTLNDVLEQKSTQVNNLFNSTDGVANKIYDLVKPYLGAGGYIASRKTSLDKDVSDLATRVTSIQNRIEKNAASLRSQYEKMQMQLVSLYNSQSIFSSSY